MKKPFVYLSRKRALGDVLWIEPTIRQLASRHKKVIVYTRSPELFLNYPLSNVRFTDHLLWWEQVIRAIGRLLPGMFIHLDNSYERNQKMHILSAYQQAAGLPLTREYPKLYLDEKEAAFRPAEAGAERYVVLHLESLAELNYRKVYGIEWDIVVGALMKRGFRVLLIGKEPVPVAGAITIKTSVREMMGVIRNASFFIGIDSGPSHIAASLGVPSLIFFGAVDPGFRHFPDQLKGRILQQYCEFAGCFHESKEKKPACRLVGNEGIPQCALHTTEYVLNNIDSLIRDYHI